MSGIVKPLFGAQLNLAHPLAQGLVGCWLMNENSGNLVHDYSGQGNVGTLSGFNDPPIATSGWNAGPHGGALVFDGINDYGLISNLSLNNTDQITIVGSFSFTNATTRALFEYSVDYNANNAFCVFLSSPAAGKIFLGDKGVAGYNLVNTVQTYNDGDSHHFAGIIDRKQGISQNKIYIDGKEDWAQNATYKADNNGNFGGPYNAYVGSRNGLSYFFSGFLSYLMIYNRALSIDEISYLSAFPYCMFDPPAYPSWLKQRVATGLLSATFTGKSPGAAFTGKSPGAAFTGKSPGVTWSN